VSQPLGTFQRQLPIRADSRLPSPVVGVLGAEQDGADLADQVVPGRGPGLAVRADPPQHAQADEYGEPVPGGDHAAEPERGELASGQHAVLGDRAHQATVTAGQMRGRRQYQLI
jgi:hypothetical protein